MILKSSLLLEMVRPLPSVWTTGAFVGYDLSSEKGIAAPKAGPSILKSFCSSLAIVSVGFGFFRVTLNAVVDFRQLHHISFDPREDPWFRYAGFVTPTVLTLLALVGFHDRRSAYLNGEQRYDVFVGTIVGLGFLLFILFCWIVY
jgi:hypothetical protein